MGEQERYVCANCGETEITDEEPNRCSECFSKRLWSDGSWPPDARPNDKEGEE